MSESLLNLRTILNALYSVAITEDSKYNKDYEKLIKDIEHDIKIKEHLDGRLAKFPDDFIIEKHEFVKNCKVYKLNVLESDYAQILVLGGGLGVRGNGKKTFELIDLRYDNPPEMPFLTSKDINEYLIKNPVIL